MAKILIVEDSTVDQLLIKRLLVRPEWVTQIASNGKEAVELISKVRPDIVITDMQMPVMDGLELVKFVRENDPSLPIVLVTAKGSEQTAVEALRSGATSYSPKSRLSADLAATVEQVLEMAQRMQYSHDSDFYPTPKSHAVVLENDLQLIGPTIENIQANLPAWSVEYEFSDQHICIQVSDEGPGFDPSSIQDPRTPENLHRISGRGLFLIRNFMDQVAHNATGNQITMTKLRQSSDEE